MIVSNVFLAFPSILDLILRWTKIYVYWAKEINVGEVSKHNFDIWN